MAYPIQMRPATPATPFSYKPPHRGKEQEIEAYAIGDVYQRLDPTFSPVIELRAQGPYIDHIRALSGGWPHLQYLADFMDVTTAPVKQKWLSGTSSSHLQDRQERASRTKVAMLDFVPGQKADRTNCNSIDELHAALRLPQDKSTTIKGRLFVVEDLSCEVIEALGAKFDIDPLFFRSQISDYMWNNPRDPWVELPSLDVTSRERSHFSVRYFHPRYFKNQDSYKEADTQAGGFNVLRRIDNNRPWGGTETFDAKGSDVGLVRSKMSLWIRKTDPTMDITLGVLLVDPTIKQGFPLWGGYQNFQTSLSIHKHINAADIPPKSSVFEEAVYWASSLSQAEIDSLRNDPRILIKGPLYIVCAEWVTLVKYLTTRLTQLEWELDNNKDTPFQHPEGLEAALKSLNMWRRRMPVYQEWMSETLSRVIIPNTFMGMKKESAIIELKDDFNKLEANLKTVAERADRIQTSVSAIISITENKKAVELNRQASRLTYLAVTFVPMTFVSGFFSMQPDLRQLNSTFWQYFTTAVPLTLLALVLLRYYTRAENRYRTWKEKRAKEKKSREEMLKKPPQEMQANGKPTHHVV